MNAVCGRVSRTRITQIMDLLQLAPDIQEELLFLPRIERGKEAIQEWEVRGIAAVPDWRKQRKIWKEFRPADPVMGRNSMQPSPQHLGSLRGNHLAYQRRTE